MGRILNRVDAAAGGRSAACRSSTTLPLSRVTHTGPSFDPVQKTPASSRDERIE
jgi:hypothetical protein